MQLRLTIWIRSLVCAVAVATVFQIAAPVGHGLGNLVNQVRMHDALQQQRDRELANLKAVQLWNQKLQYVLTRYGSNSPQMTQLLQQGPPN